MKAAVLNGGAIQLLLGPPCSPLRDIVFHRIESGRRVQKPLGTEMRFEFREQRIALSFSRALYRRTTFVVRRCDRGRAKFRA